MRRKLCLGDDENVAAHKRPPLKGPGGACGTLEDNKNYKYVFNKFIQ